jgi:hypothetical protein
MKITHFSDEINLNTLLKSVGWDWLDDRRGIVDGLQAGGQRIAWSVLEFGRLVGFQFLSVEHALTFCRAVHESKETV